MVVSVKDLLFEYKKCPFCKDTCKNVKSRRMSTMFSDEKDNITICCEECFRDIEEYWKERWADYWAGIM